MWTWLTEIGALFEANAATASKDLVQGGIAIGETVVTDLKSLFSTGVPIAIAEVKKQWPLVVSGKEKFSQAVTDTWQKLEVAVGPVVQQDVETIVQMAYHSVNQALNDLAGSGTQGA